MNLPEDVLAIQEVETWINRLQQPYATKFLKPLFAHRSNKTKSTSKHLHIYASTGSTFPVARS